MKILKRIIAAFEAVDETRALAKKIDTQLQTVGTADTEIVQALVDILDGIFLVGYSASRSGNRKAFAKLDALAKQSFATAGRIGIEIVVAESGKPFDSKIHRLADGKPQPETSCTIRHTIVPGYRFRGKLVRLPLVALI